MDIGNLLRRGANATMILSGFAGRLYRIHRELVGGADPPLIELLTWAEDIIVNQVKQPEQLPKVIEVLASEKVR